MIRHVWKNICFWNLYSEFIMYATFYELILHRDGKRESLRNINILFSWLCSHPIFLCSGSQLVCEFEDFVYCSFSLQKYKSWHLWRYLCYVCFVAVSTLNSCCISFANLALFEFLYLGRYAIHVSTKHFGISMTFLFTICIRKHIF